MTLEFRPWMAWPNSWNMVVASSHEISTGSPGGGFTKLVLLETIGVTGRFSRSWVRYSFIQAPEVLPSRA